MNISQVVIVIITYNLTDNILKNYDNYENVIVVDNTDSMNYINLEEYCTENVTLIKNKFNLGIATALNIGCQKALDLGYEFVITMDQDSVITLDIINKLIDYYAANKTRFNIAVLSPTHLMQENTVSSKQFLNNSNQDAVNSIFTMTSGNLLSLDAWNKIGKFNDELFIDMVDTDFYIRAMLKNYQVITLTNVYMRHSLGDLKVKKILHKKMYVLNHSYVRKYYQARNMLWLVSKYYKSYPESRRCLRTLLNIFIGAVFFEQDKLKKLKYMIKGVRDFFIGKMGKLHIKASK